MFSRFSSIFHHAVDAVSNFKNFPSCHKIYHDYLSKLQKVIVVKSVPPLSAVLSLVLCFEFKNKCKDFMLLATHMLRYSASCHFSRMCYTFVFVAEFFKPWRSWRKPKALSRNGLVSYEYP